MEPSSTTSETSQRLGRSGSIPLRRYASLLTRYLRPQWPRALLMAALLLSGTALQLLVPQILRFFIDTAAAGGELSSLLRAGGLFLAVALAHQLTAAGATYTGADVGWRATNSMRRDLTEHILGLDMSFHNARTPGELIERIDGDVTSLSNFFSQFLVRVVGGLLLLVGILALLWREDARVGLALTLFSVIAFVLLNKTRELAVPATRKERESSAKLFGFIEERLAGIDDIRANGGGPFVMHSFYKVVRDYFYKGRRAWMMRLSVWLLSFGLFTGGDVIALGSAVALFESGSITLGTAFLIFQYLLMLETPIEQITQQMQELQRAAAGIGRVDELFETRTQLPQGKGVSLPEGALEVSFDKVSFAYDDVAVLKGVSFRLEPGTVLGLLGRTGSGKSTLTRLLFRFYDPTAGSVRVAGVDTREACVAELRQRVGMVTQEVQLFQASVRDNLTFFDGSIPDARIGQVLDDLGLRGWLETLPAGLDTMLAAGGGGLSAGQAQLLAFARVFLKDPGLVILDEPSSRLDPATEALLERAMTRLLEGRTAIIIAHRLGTVARADEIMVLEQGRVLEHAPRERLAADPGSRFYRLLQAGNHLDLEQTLEEHFERELI